MSVTGKMDKANVAGSCNSEVGHHWATSLSLFTFMHWTREWQPTPVSLPGESQGRGEPGGLPSMGSHRVGHDWSDLAAAAACNNENTQESHGHMDQHNNILKTKIKQRKQVAGFVHYNSTHVKLFSVCVCVCIAYDIHCTGMTSPRGKGREGERRGEKRKICMG